MQLNVIFFFDLFSHEINVLFRLDFPKKKKSVERTVLSNSDDSEIFAWLFREMWSRVDNVKDHQTESIRDSSGFTFVRSFVRSFPG